MSEKAKRFRSSIYVIDPQKGVARLKNKLCPRCGSVMGRYTSGGERWYCGKCHYTEFLGPGERGAR